MSQNDILSVLQKNKGFWFSARDFSKFLNINNVSASRSVSRIIKFKNVYGVDVRIDKFNKYFIRIK